MLSLLFTAPLAIAWLGCFSLAWELGLHRRAGLDWRLCWLYACLGFGALLTLIVEFTSLFHALSRFVLVLLWLMVDVFLWWGIASVRKRRVGEGALQPLPADASFQGRFGLADLLQGIVSLRVRFRSWPADARITMVFVWLLIGFLFFVAVLAPTANADSRAYHLPRIMHWIQQGSVEHFQTDDLRQLEFGPWSSFAAMNWLLLWGNDRLLNLTQWFAMLSSVIILSWMVEKLGELGCEIWTAEKRARILAFTALLGATLPIGIVESITTQNDYSTAFFVLGIFAFALLLKQEPRNGWYVLGCGLAAGLGTLTKATAYMFSGPLIVIGGIFWLSRICSKQAMPDGPGPARSGFSQGLRLALLFTGLFFVLNGAHMVRNFVLFGSPLGSQEILALERNDRISLRVGASNFIRNLVLHTSTPSKWVTQQLNKGVAWAHQLTGEDLNDPETTFQYCRFQFPRNYLVSDSWATCIIHLLLCGVACAFAFVRPLRNLQFNAYIGLTVASVLFFCFFLRWQAWHARIHMTWFLLLAPVTAILIIRELPPWTIRFSSLALLALAGATIVANSSQPVFQAAYWRLPREQRYFALGAEETNRELLRLANTIIASKYRNIGLKADSCEAEYPLWVMLRNRGFQGRIDRCYVGNVSARLPNSGHSPEMIISTFDIVPPAVAESFPRREKYGNLTALWPDHDVFAASRR